MATPLSHLTDKWKKHVILGDEIASNHYEAAAFEALNARIRSGDVAVGGSRRHQPFEDYLLPKQEFAQLIEKKETRLAVKGTAEHYLEQKQQEFVEKLPRLWKSIGVVPGSLRLDEHGKLQLPPLEKAVPEQAEYHSRRLATFLPRIPLADLLLEVDKLDWFFAPPDPFKYRNGDHGISTADSGGWADGNGNELRPFQNGGLMPL